MGKILFSQFFCFIYELNVNSISMDFYCRYTSIGDRSNTRPNPHLMRKNVITGKEEYLHASNLIDMDEFERAGRF